LVIVGLPTSVLATVSWSTWSDVERVDLSRVLTGSPTATNYLVVGTDSRAGIDPGIENAAAIFGDGVAGERTDTVAVLRIDGGDVSLLAIPRDLYVAIDGSGTRRINAAYVFGGPELLIDTVQRQLGIGIDHYLEVDIAGFLGLVDALGGVTIDFPYPATDNRSGLNVGSGPQLLDGNTALAFVRSRHYTEFRDGVAVTDPTSDLGRVQRQQQFMGSIFAALGETKNPIVLLDALRAVSANVRVDDQMSLRDAAGLGLVVRGSSPQTATVPTSRYITPNGADVLLIAPEADQVLAPFRR